MRPHAPLFRMPEHGLFVRRACSFAGRQRIGACSILTLSFERAAYLQRHQHVEFGVLREVARTYRLGALLPRQRSEEHVSNAGARAAQMCFCQALLARHNASLMLDCASGYCRRRADSFFETGDTAKTIADLEYATS